MNSKNDENTGAALVLAFVGFAALLLFAVLAFIALVMTILSLCAWDKPLTIGKMTITTEQARDFIGRGVIGAIVLPVFVVFACVLFGIKIEEWVWPYILIAGYTAASLGVDILTSMEAESSLVQELRTPPPAAIAPPPQSSAPPAFKFANWNDEEHGG